MKRCSCLFLLVLSSFLAHSQALPGNTPDTSNSILLKEARVTARWRNDTDRYHYNQMKYYVTTILPYLNAATKLFNEINAETQKQDISRKERRRFINMKEDGMRTGFEDKVKGLNTTQGVLLVKLIARQTEVNIYEMLQEFKNPFTAIRWQAWARINGMNLNKKYDPNEEHDLENIMDELGYPLPGGYLASQTH
jgi:uncharacterized protein DUF4294